MGLREVLKQRKAEYLAIQDPIERKKQEWTQSDVFYATRKLLIDNYGYTDKEISEAHQWIKILGGYCYHYPTVCFFLNLSNTKAAIPAANPPPIRLTRSP